MLQSVVTKPMMASTVPSTITFGLSPIPTKVTTFVESAVSRAGSAPVPGLDLSLGILPLIEARALARTARSALRSLKLTPTPKWVEPSSSDVGIRRFSDRPSNRPRCAAAAHPGNVLTVSELFGLRDW